MATNNGDVSPQKVVIDVADAKAMAQAKSAQKTASRSKLWIVGSLVGIVVVLGIGLGVGLGVGLKKKDETTADLYGNLKTYYIAADVVTWDYAPGGINKCLDMDLLQKANIDLDAPNRVVPQKVGGAFKKALYRQYTDSSFATLVQRPQNQAHLGMFGPLIYAEAGSQFRIIFKNNLPFDANLEPLKGITWTIPRPGPLPPVKTGQTLELVFTVPNDVMKVPAGPLKPGTQTSRLILYHSSVNPLAHDHAGLVGGIIVTAKGYANPDGTTKDVDRDIVTLYQVIDEQASPFAFENGDNKALAGAIFTKMGVNGYTWCTTNDIVMNVGERVRWHVATIGSFASTHNYHWHGNTFLRDGRRVDAVHLMGANTASLDMNPDAPGSWMFHCHLNFHLDGGMAVLYTVKGPAKTIATAPGGRVRTYYMQAEEVDWNFAPLGQDNCTGTPQPFDEGGDVFLGEPNAEMFRIGSVYRKAMYRQYTDDTFKTVVNRTADEAYLGILGPIMRAEVGDVIKVVFKNNMSYPATVHPHGVLYDKAGEGAPYLDGTDATMKGDDAVMPGETYTYTWGVPERAGPGPQDTSNVMWMYHSHVHETGDTSAGLMGAIIINKAGSSRNASASVTDSKGMYPTDVDEEAVLYFSVVNEAASIYNYDNIKKYLPEEMWNTTEALEALFADETFAESSLKHAINGLMYCNVQNLKFTQGKRVRLHIMALGTQEDMHTPNIGGGSFAIAGAHRSTVAVLAGGMMTSDVVFTQPGNFMMACRVADHVLSGMKLLYDVAPSGTAVAAVAGARTREYFLKAEPVTWNFAPQGYKQCGLTQEYNQFRSSLFVKSNMYQIGPKRSKAQYVAYTDATFTKPAPKEDYLGLIGPLITAEVGDILKVTFKNDLDFTVAWSPDGGLVALGFNETEAQKGVAPGETFTYTYIVPVQAGPLEGDLTTVAYPYLSGIDIAGHGAAGLVGVMAIGQKGSFKADGVTPVGVDKLVVLTFMVFNEEMSPFYQKDFDTAFGTNLTESDLELIQTAAFSETNMMHGINGYIYCNMPNLKASQGSTVRVITASFGSEEGMHSPEFLGQPAVMQAGALEFQQILPAVTAVGDVEATTPGDWPIYCNVHQHQASGMYAQWTVTPAATSRRLRA